MLTTLQYCIGFAIHQHESATGIHVFPILNPFPPPSCTIPLDHLSTPAPSIQYHASNLDTFSLLSLLNISQNDSKYFKILYDYNVEKEKLIITF